MKLCFKWITAPAVKRTFAGDFAMRAWKSGLRVIVPAALLILAIASPPAFAQGGGGGGKKGGGETSLGNNLSVPAVFAEGYGVTGLAVSQDTGLRPRPGESCYSATFSYATPCLVSTTAVLKDGVTYYPQNSESAWQAQWSNGSSSQQNVTVNWSDNLTQQFWTPKSKIRVETVLYQNPDQLSFPDDHLIAYDMTLLSGSKTTESWGTQGTTYDSFYRTVFSPNARLTIQKISGKGGTPVGSPCFDKSVYEGFGLDGPGNYTAEVNVSGNLIYGYNWTLKNCGTDLLGWWRLTFQIDPTAIYSITPEGGTAVNYSVPRNTFLTALDAADLEALFVPTIDTANDASILEIEIRSTRSGGGKKGRPLVHSGH